ncbi:MAG: hypothetical protein GY792_10505 [Gammaproteobacteria bacterium]|nr:hypothetical protein [Gammaproteobacteria bacterium]
MGGPGSGSWYRWNKKTTAEEVHRVDIRYMRKQGLLRRPGSTGSLSWSCGGEQTGSIRYRVERDRLVLMYRHRSGGDDWQGIEEPVWFDRTPCNFGGERLWFLCPHCSKRVAVLYGAGARFLCRHCYDLPYASQIETYMDRMMRRARKVRDRLGVSGDLSEPIWRKPKGMHQTTFDPRKSSYPLHRIG